MRFDSAFSFLFERQDEVQVYPCQLGAMIWRGEKGDRLPLCPLPFPATRLPALGSGMSEPDGALVDQAGKHFLVLVTVQSLSKVVQCLQDLP